MKLQQSTSHDSGVSTLTEYVTISGILLVLLTVTILVVNSIFIGGPLDRLAYNAYVDIGNGMSTRIVDLYVIAPENGTITTIFDIPDDVAGRNYYVEVNQLGVDQEIVVSDGEVSSTVTVAGIGGTRGITGNTTGSGWNRIMYSSEGY
jgi:hypothetical protein